MFSAFDGVAKGTCFGGAKWHKHGCYCVENSRYAPEHVVCEDNHRFTPTDFFPNTYQCGAANSETSVSGYCPKAACTCKEEWSYSSNDYSGCDNNSPGASNPWCVVTAPCLGSTTLSGRLHHWVKCTPEITITTTKKITKTTATATATATTAATTITEKTATNATTAATTASTTIASTAAPSPTPTTALGKECVCLEEWSYEEIAYTGCPPSPIVTDNDTYTWCYTTGKCIGSDDSKHTSTNYPYKQWAKCGASASPSPSASDSDSATSAASTMTTTTINTVDPYNNSSATTNTQLQKSSSAGIAVGVTFGVLLIFAAAVLLILRQKRNRDHEDADAGVDALHVGNLPFDPNGRPAAVQLVPNVMYRPADGSNDAGNAEEQYTMAGGYAGVFAEGVQGNNNHSNNSNTAASTSSAIVYAVPVMENRSVVSTYSNEGGSAADVEPGTVVYMPPSTSSANVVATAGGDGSRSGRVPMYSVPTTSREAAAAARNRGNGFVDDNNTYDMAPPGQRSATANNRSNANANTANGIVDGNNTYDMAPPGQRSATANNRSDANANTANGVVDGMQAPRVRARGRGGGGGKARSTQQRTPSIYAGFAEDEEV